MLPTWYIDSLNGCVHVLSDLLWGEEMVPYIRGFSSTMF